MIKRTHAPDDLNQKHYKRMAVLLSLLLGLLFLFIFYHSMLLNPNDYLYTDWGDGIKNYYTYAWHVKYDTSFIHFSGMNYPYGELHQFTDGQPFLANVVKLVGKIFPGIEEYAIGILNLCMLLSFVLGAMVLSAIFHEYKIPPVLSAIASVAIIALSPQIHRFGGHLSLSYYFAFPVSWYLLIRFFKSHKWIYSIMLLAISLILLFTHPYLFIICSAFIIVSYIIGVFYGATPTLKRLVLHASVQVLLPLIIWAAFIALFDHHANRPQQLFSYDYVATFAGTFLPNTGILNAIMNKLFTGGINAPWESWSYIGLLSVLVLIFLSIRIFSYIISKGRNKILPHPTPVTLVMSLISSIIILIFASGLPYKAGLSVLFDVIPALQQVRVIARFSWVFFYVIHVFSIVLIYNSLKNKKDIFQYISFIIVFALIFFEAIQHHKSFSSTIIEKRNYFSENISSSNQYLKAVSQIDVNAYQAILPLPYYHIGSNTYRLLHKDHEGFAESLLLSYHTRLPLISSNLSRTSKTEAKNLLMLFTPPYHRKPVLKHFDDKPILLLVTDTTKVREREQWLISRAESITQLSGFSLFSILPNQLTEFDYEDLKELMPEQPEQLKKNHGFYVDGTKKPILFINNDSKWPSPMLDTNSFFSTDQDGYHAIAKLPASMFDTDKQYELSFWYFNKGQDRLISHFFIKQKDNSGKKQWTDFFSLREGTHYDNWSLIRKNFKVLTQNDSISFIIYDDNHDKIYYNDFLIREKNHDVFYMISDSLLFRNNLRIPIDSSQNFFIKQSDEQQI